MLFALLTHPHQLDEVAQDPELRPAAIEEGLRWQTPLVLIARECVRDARLGGVDIPAGSGINVFIASANRDEKRYSEPDRFDIHRSPAPHVSFGSGPHTCLGIHLARMESRVALDAVLERLPDLRLDPAAPPPRIVGSVFRSPDALPVCFRPLVGSPYFASQGSGMGFELQGSRVLVTGASSGIGAGLAEAFARAGASVGMCARRADRLGEVAERCRAHGAETYQWITDLAVPAQVDELAREVLDEMGGVDILVNNAGIPKRRHVTATDAATVDRVTQINYLAPIRLTLALLPRCSSAAPDASSTCRRSRQRCRHRVRPRTRRRSLRWRCSPSA